MACLVHILKIVLRTIFQNIENTILMLFVFFRIIKKKIDNQSYSLCFPCSSYFL